jgi:DNA topoisomerase-1
MTPEKLANYVKKDLLLKVYKIIWQRTIASAMPDAQISETTYTIDNGDHLFNLVSNEVVNLGYRAVYSYKDEDAEEEQTLTNTFEKNEILNKCQLDGVEKATKPKARYKEATFIKELQADGVGRPSTFASILKTIEDPGRGYCTLTNKELVPTKLGLQVVDFLSRAFPAIVNASINKLKTKYPADTNITFASISSSMDELISQYIPVEKSTEIYMAAYPFSLT